MSAVFAGFVGDHVISRNQRFESSLPICRRLEWSPLLRHLDETKLVQHARTFEDRELE